MDEQTFQKELKKYKVVRDATFHRVKMNRQKASTGQRMLKAPTQAAPLSPRGGAGGSESADFYTLLRTAVLSSGFTAQETDVFINRFRTEQTRVAKKTNLDQLEQIAASTA